MSPFRAIAVLLPILGGLPPQVLATEGLARGRVFEDRNDNGRMEPGEPGIGGVAVSNGAAVVLTGADGSYEIPWGPDDRIFVIKPRGWAPPFNALHLPHFYAERSASPDSVDFALRLNPEPDDLRALVLTDPQPASTKEVGYLERGIADRFASRGPFAFGVTLGDVVYDRQDLYPEVNRALARIGVPWFNLLGNHDLNLNSGGDRAASHGFEAAYGPSTYAFHWGPACFVALNDVRYLGGPRYLGGLRTDQFAFLEQFLPTVGPDEWIVVMAHIPLFSPDPSNLETFRSADRARLFALLKAHRRVLLLTGHTHYQRHVFHGLADGWDGPEPLHEYNVAAACGGFWGGPRDSDGIPLSTQSDGTPPGGAILTIRGNQLLLDYVPARLPPEVQLTVHAPAVLAPHQGYVSFYANVFNGHDGWTVRARIDRREFVPIHRILGWDPTYAAAFLAQDAGPLPGPIPRLPDPSISYHLWRSYLPADLGAGAHSLTVEATDPSGRAYSATEIFRVIAGAP